MYSQAFVRLECVIVPDVSSSDALIIHSVLCKVRAKSTGLHTSRSKADVLPSCGMKPEEFLLALQKEINQIQSNQSNVAGDTN